MNSKRILIKLGGAALTDPTTLESVVETIHHIRNSGQQVILVHGGGPTINNELRLRGIDWTFVRGQRVTSAPMMDVIEYALCGIVNRSLVRYLGAHELQAIGLAGSDRRTLLCTPASAELGLVGKIESINASWIEDIVATGSVPVIAPIGVGHKGEAYNINADWAASHLAVALHADQLLFLTDQTGILDPRGQLIAQVDSTSLRKMVQDEVVTGGMLTKTLAILHALENGVKNVRVTNSKGANQSSRDSRAGTSCTLTNSAGLKRQSSEADHALA